MAKRKKQNEEEPKDENLNKASESDDTFGLPEIEYEPINRDEPTSVAKDPEPEPEQPAFTAPEPTPSYSSTEQFHQPMEDKSEYKYTPPLQESSSAVPKILGILFVIVVALGAAWFFLVYQPNEKEKAEKVRLAQEAANKKRQAEEEAERLRQQQAQEAEQRRLDSLANIPKIGTIEQLSARTGRYYVVVASAIDDDLLMDKASKMTKNGVNIKIIPPFGKYKFYRLTIADGGSFAEAQNIADSKKADYGDAVWVLKY